MTIPWQINVELRMTPEDAAGLLAVLDRDKHGLLAQALEFQLKDFTERGFTPGTLVLGLTIPLDLCAECGGVGTVLVYDEFQGATTDDYHSEVCPSCHPGHSVKA